MAAFPEHEPKQSVVEHSDLDVSELKIENKNVITPVPTQFKAQVHDPSGKPLISTPQTQTVTITVPVVSIDDAKQEAKKGDVENSSTWSLAFWVRTVLKAWHKGYEVMFRGKDTN